MAKIKTKLKAIDNRLDEIEAESNNAESTLIKLRSERGIL